VIGPLAGANQKKGPMPVPWEIAAIGYAVVSITSVALARNAVGATSVDANAYRPIRDWGEIFAPHSGNSICP